MEYLISNFKCSLENILSFINKCNKIKTKSDCQHLLGEINKLTPFQSAAIFQIKCNKENKIISHQKVIHKGCDEYWYNYEKNKYLNIDPVVSQAMHYIVPVKWSDTYNNYRNKQNDSEIENLIKTVECFHKEQSISYAINTNTPNRFTLFSIQMKPDYFNNTSIHLLKILLPYAHKAIHRVFASSLNNAENALHLTTREREVLKWVIQGKTSWETGKILSITERTVKFHLNNTYQKLNVTNRTQAIATAMNYGLV